MAGVLRLWLVIELLHSLPAVAQVHDQEGFSLVHQTNHHDLVLLRVWKLQRILGGLDIVRKDLQFRHSSLSGGWLHLQYDLILQLHLEPLSRSEAGIDADSGVERYVELADAGDEVGDVLEVFGLAAPVERVVIIVLPLSSLVDEAFQWPFGVGEVFDSAEVDLQVLFFPAREVVLLFEVDLLLNFNRFDLLQFGLKVSLHLLLHSFLEPHVEVRPIRQHALDQLSVLALEEAEHCHPLLIIVELVLVGPGLEVGEESQDAPSPFVEGDAHLFLELLAFVPRSFLHCAPII